jgi:hypothetical protein
MYSGASPVLPANLVAAMTVKNAVPETINLKKRAKLSTAYDSPKNVPSKPMARRTAALAKVASVPRTASPPTMPEFLSPAKTPPRRTTNIKTDAMISGKSPIIAAPVTGIIPLQSRRVPLRPPAAEFL